MLKKLSSTFAPVAAAILLGAILAWPDSSRPSSPRTSSVRAATHSKHRDFHTTRRPEKRPRDGEPQPGNTPTWPLPEVPASEVETKRTAMMDAFEEASKIDDPAAQNAALTRICYHWAGFDPRGAVETAIAWELDETPGLYENLALQWASADLPSAREWAGLQPPGEFRSELVMRIGYAMAQDDPANAAAYVIRETSPGPVQAEAALSVLHQWALKDPAGARAWAEDALLGDLKERAFQEIAGLEGYRQAVNPQRPHLVR